VLNSGFRIVRTQVDLPPCLFSLYTARRQAGLPQLAEAYDPGAQGKEYATRVAGENGRRGMAQFHYSAHALVSITIRLKAGGNAISRWKTGDGSVPLFGACAGEYNYSP